MTKCGVLESMSISALNFLRRYGTLFGFVAIVLLFWMLKPTTFMTVQNWLNITQQVSILCVVAFTSTVVMAVGAFDLSVGTMASLASMVAAVLMQAEYGIFIACFTALLVALLCGALNGWVVSYLGIGPFVATLGSLTAFGGLALFISDGNTIFGRAIPAAFGEFGRRGLQLGNFTFPNLTIVMLVVLATTWWVLERTVFGRRLYAIFGNREAARLTGIRVRWLSLCAFAISGLGAGIAGLMLTSRLASANPNQGDPLMLNAIAAVFLGMTMNEEGEPHILATLVGVLILGVLANGLTQLQINSYIQQIITGTLIVLAVGLSRLSRR
jgi:ribose transport system permease protein